MVVSTMPKEHSDTHPHPCVYTDYTYSRSSSYSWSVLEFEQEHKVTPVVEAPRMSRRSLRLHTAPGHRGSGGSHYSLLESHSASPSLGPSREDRALKSRRSHHHAVSGSQSVLLTPQKSQSLSQSLPLNTSLHSCAASDASLLSSLLDESCIQERTLMDSFWGLDEDGEHKDRTILAGGDVLTAQTQTSVMSGITCKDCSFQQSATTHSSSKHPSSSSSSSSSSKVASAAHQHTAPNTASHGTTVYSRDKVRKHRPAGWSYCSNMKSEGCPKQDVLQNTDASLCDDCKGRQHLDVRSAKEQADHTHTPKANRAWAVLSALVANTAQGSSSIWQQLLALMSLFRDFLVTRCLPNLYRLVLLLLPLLLIMVLCYWGPSTLWAVLPTVNITDWSIGSVKEISLEQDHVVPYVQPPFPAESEPSSSSPPMDTERVARVARMERSLAELWARVARGERQQQEQSAQLQALYRPLQERLESGAHLQQLQTSVASMVNEKLQPLKDEVEKNTNNMQLQQQWYVSQQQRHQNRVAELEAMLETVARKTEDIQRAQETTTPAPASEVVDRISHEALLLEVQRLEASLASIRADLQEVMGCQGRCEQLDNIQNMVSAQVKEQLEELFYGTEAKGAVVPESLLLWLSARFVNGSDLAASLANLEQSILGNVSELVEQSRQRQQSVCAESLSERVRLSTSQSGLAEQQVDLIVKNALRLYSQDRTGMVDYALESGGGSILSTRCSETFETKTALMSLFGLPLWYFTQSPRVVIQPDVHPGNCWAFKGSHGYLVIRLSMRVVPIAFSLEHIPKSLSPTGHITSAPRDYAVYGLEDEHQEEGKLLGRYTYEEDGEALQTNPVTEPNSAAFQVIELRVLSNWGHSEYTCLYRFRVHGRPPAY